MTPRIALVLAGQAHADHRARCEGQPTPLDCKALR
jgi:hypothetical protein